MSARRRSNTSARAGLAFDHGATALFTFRSRELAEWTLAKLRGTQSAIEQSLARGDVAAAMAIDPFVGLASPK